MPWVKLVVVKIWFDFIKLCISFSHTVKGIDKISERIAKVNSTGSLTGRVWIQDTGGENCFLLLQA